MFLKKRHHADIMARLHADAPKMLEDSDDDDSGFASDLIIDEDMDTADDTKEELKAHFTFNFDAKNKPVLEQVILILSINQFQLETRSNGLLRCVMY